MFEARPIAQVESERLALVGVRFQRLPIELIVAITQFLQARRAGGILFNAICGYSEAACQGWYRHCHA
jgi:hypothetical protein